MKKKRVASIVTKGYRVIAPEGRRKDGEWSRREKIVAMFLDRAEAAEYAFRTSQSLQGSPVKVVGHLGDVTYYPYYWDHHDAQSGTV